MKSLAKIIVAIVLIGAIGIGGIGYYMGMFDTIVVEEKEMGPYVVAYQAVTGPYTEVGPAMNEVYEGLLENDIQSTVGVGLFYDDPRVVAPEDLRSEVGSLITEEDTKLESTAYEIKRIPARKSIVAKFPYKNALSYMLGPIKIYPALEKYMAEHGYVQGTGEELPAIELYDMEANEIVYILQPVME